MSSCFWNAKPEQHIALVIGNADYKEGKLSSPTNDAQEYEAVNLGFVLAQLAEARNRLYVVIVDTRFASEGRAKSSEAKTELPGLEGTTGGAIFLSPLNLTDGSGPVLAKAAKMLGAEKFIRREAGKLFPSTFILWLW